MRRHAILNGGLRAVVLASALVLVGAAATAPATRAQAPAKSGTARLHLVWTNDIHGHVAPEGATFMNPAFPPALGGGASAMAYVEHVREEVAGKPDEGMLLVDAGDTYSGAPVGSLTHGRVMETYFRLMQYDAVAPGNHEFDQGVAVARGISEGMHQKFLCANLFKAGTDSLVDWVEPCRVVERAGLRIGLIGAVTPGTKEMAFADNVAGLDFRPILPEVEKWRDILKSRDHVDLVILIVHEGLPFDSQEAWDELQQRAAKGEDLRQHVDGALVLADVLEGVAVIVGGHTHRGYREPWVDPVTHTMVFETFGNGSSIGHAILTVDRSTGIVTSFESPRRDGVLVTLFEDQYWPEQTMADSLIPYERRIQQGLSQRVGRSRVDLTRSPAGNSPMGNFVTDAMREATDADVAFTNNGGIRADLPAGPITAEDILKVEPFGNSLAVVEMDGAMLRQVIERKSGRGSAGITQSGAKIVVDPDAPQGRRLLEMTIGGQPLDPEHVYRVATTDYLMEGNSGLDFLAQIPPDHVEYTMTLVQDALKRYLQQHSPIAPATDDRWVERPGGTPAPYLQNAQPQ